MNVYELNIDGLVGPTHHYAGMSEGNIASMSHSGITSNPQAAALQGLSKMRLLHQLGVKQAIMPPHPRPNIDLLRQLGFTGTLAQILQTAQREAPKFLSACYSASSMWTANAATVSPSTDTADKRVHFTAANLVNHLHRHQEANFSAHLLREIFSNEQYFHHHPPIPANLMTRDEGAANHNRLCKTHGDEGIHLYVYNQHMLPLGHRSPVPSRFPARQTREASEAVARSHLLNQQHVFFALQNPEVVDLGVFHNDVISVCNESVFLVHEDAFFNQHEVLAALQARSNHTLHIIEIKREQISVQDAVETYLFNSQLVTLPNQTMALIAPAECQYRLSTQQFIDDLINQSNNPISAVHYLDLKQSMRNGGGPACLRLRVVLNENELSAMHQGVLANDLLLDNLEDWVKKHYRTELRLADLADPKLVEESSAALRELATLFNLETIYCLDT